jgi:hypothetical protein
MAPHSPTPALFDLYYEVFVCSIQDNTKIMLQWTSKGAGVRLNWAIS